MLKIKLLILGILLSCTNVHKKSINTTEELSWKIESSGEISETPKEISNWEFLSNGWLDAGTHSTILGALYKNGKYENLFVDDNFEKLPEEDFNIPWYYKSEFVISKKSKYDNYTLKFNGINYSAELWINGEKVKSNKKLIGPYKVYYIDVTDFLREGKNSVVCKVYPPSKGDLTIGWVDWNPWPKDNNTGLWRSVELIKSKNARIKSVFIKPNLNDNLFNNADIDIITQIKNYSDRAGKYKIRVKIDKIFIEKEIILDGNEEKEILLNSEDYSQLKIQDPKLWWPNNMGIPNLYKAEISLYKGEEKLENKQIKFGIRKIEDYITEKGYRGYKINGKKFLIKGAGWTDDILLSDTFDKVEKQIQYVKDMNLNTIRLEGFWGTDNRIYEMCDEYGILIMVGLSCHWEWKDYCGREDDEYMAVRTPDEIRFMTESYKDQIMELRNHPSVFLWVFGSDKLPRPEFEKELLNVTDKYDGTRPTLSACRGLTADGSVSNVSTITGSPRVKMLGPYSYVTPNYWYVDTTHGGAFGFNTETGPGLQPPVKESLKRMLSPENLWPVNKYWEYHTGRSAFQTFDRWMVPFEKRYGKSKSLEDFSLKAQMSNYEAVRAMFEAFRVNKPNTTGIIQWMLNSSWPSMLWQLYDWYLIPTGAYYGTKTACKPLNLIYNYKDGSIYLVSEQNTASKNLTCEIKVYNDKFELSEEQKLNEQIEENFSKKAFEIDENKIKTNLYFISMRLFDKGKLVSKNFYWLSKKKDIQDFSKTTWYITPNKEYADFTGIYKLPKAKISVEKIESFKKFDKYRIKNISDEIAFFIQLKTYLPNDEITPSIISDNYFSLLPGEDYEVVVDKLGITDVKLKYRFWNEE